MPETHGLTRKEIGKIYSEGPTEEVIVRIKILLTAQWSYILVYISHKLFTVDQNNGSMCFCDAVAEVT